jgi:hypothetical protein
LGSAPKYDDLISEATPYAVASFRHDEGAYFVGEETQETPKPVF